MTEDRMLVVTCTSDDQSAEWTVSVTTPNEEGPLRTLLGLSLVTEGLPVDDLDSREWTRDALVALVERL